MSNFAEQSKDLQVVVFSLDNQLFGLDITLVSEIIRLEKITPIPNAPDYVEGIINIRGNVIPVISLHSLFNINTEGWNENSRVIIAETGDLKFGIIVESVYEVRKISQEAVRPAPAAVIAGQEYIQGIILDGDDLIVLIELDKLVSGQDLQEVKSIL
ncbi:purine-binding chemotaxis protein CheW [Desulfotomaculum arcticum]|uniref:Purine-binding chemotaxis protein CheW n=1 Tax=Desulfotruncus arcticus DSM 17038 TaxID=1121424 RepID=A0A1I2MX89_9FIRM|nr:chemotaxis protein CheW [Desulfotruncus arcticus]SFF95269.1 purine-binding chemotaxis protein CheW [Desulfotomaculum arcticum] [Desulfotruncus arcticus DSM 17038]